MDHSLTIKVSIRLFYTNFSSEKHQADRFAELGTDSISTGSSLWTADHPSHMHVSKRIGDRFPENSYGMVDVS